MFYNPLPQSPSQEEQLDAESEYDTTCLKSSGLPRNKYYLRQPYFVAQLVLQSLMTLSCIVLIILVTLDLAAHHRSTSNKQLSPKPSVGLSNSSSIANHGLNASSSTKTQFRNDEHYMTLDHKYDYLWADELRADSGIIRIPDLEVDQAGNPQVGSISMFHQLHCLAYIRKTLQEAYEGKQIGFDGRDDKHWPHCLYHLRQSILCFADDTIERPTLLRNGTRIHSISGAWDLRQCRNADAIYEYRAKHGKNQVHLEKAESAESIS